MAPRFVCVCVICVHVASLLTYPYHDNGDVQGTAPVKLIFIYRSNFVVEETVPSTKTSRSACVA